MMRTLENHANHYFPSKIKGKAKRWWTMMEAWKRKIVKFFDIDRPAGRSILTNKKDTNQTFNYCVPPYLYLYSCTGCVILFFAKISHKHLDGKNKKREVKKQRFKKEKDNQQLNLNLLCSVWWVLNDLDKQICFFFSILTNKPNLYNDE